MHFMLNNYDTCIHNGDIDGDANAIYCDIEIGDMVSGDTNSSDIDNSNYS